MSCGDARLAGAAESICRTDDGRRINPSSHPNRDKDTAAHILYSGMSCSIERIEEVREQHTHKGMLSDSLSLAHTSPSDERQFCRQAEISC